MSLLKAILYYKIMGCLIGRAAGKVYRSTAIEIIDESEYEKNPVDAKSLCLVNKGNKIKIHYRELYPRMSFMGKKFDIGS